MLEWIGWVRGEERGKGPGRRWHCWNVESVVWNRDSGAGLAGQGRDTLAASCIRTQCRSCDADCPRRCARTAAPEARCSRMISSASDADQRLAACPEICPHSGLTSAKNPPSLSRAGPVVLPTQSSSPAWLAWLDRWLRHPRRIPWSKDIASPPSAVGTPNLLFLGSGAVQFQRGSRPVSASS